MESAREFLTHELSDMLDAERKFMEIMGQQHNEAQDPQMAKAIEQHMRQTEGQIERLENIFEMMREEPEDTECAGVAGLMEEKETFMKEDPSEELVEAFNLGAALKGEHYEIAAYNSLINLANSMKLKQAVQLLQQSLREEVQMERKVLQFSKRFRPENIGMEEEMIKVMGGGRNGSRSSGRASSRSSSSTRSSAKRSGTRSSSSRKSTARRAA